MKPENNIKERPILFNGEMVRAILDGRKTQTRRLLNPQPEDCGTELIFSGHCPFGEVGDRLWVRETWQKAYMFNHDTQTFEDDEIFVYRADDFEWCDGDGSFLDPSDSKSEIPPWKPSIHMPREACRIVLEITNIRIERVSDISVEDAKKEGAPDGEENPQAWFKNLWESINGPGSFHVEVWAWVIEFKRIAGPAEAKQ